MIVKAYVINLERRPDRLARFCADFEANMPAGIPLEFIRAVDGREENYMNTVPEDLKKLVSTTNDYSTKPTVHATIFSHLVAWKSIVDSSCKFGIIFEDDAIFGRSKEINKEVTIKALVNYPSNTGILYFGVGDSLPIHITSTPNESILAQQEKVIKDLGWHGVPNFKSAFVFDWLGGFSYTLSRQVAGKLLKIAESRPIDCAIDSWMKKLYLEGEIEIYLSVPLLTYTSLTDSDTT
jgi:GR25 family glycosyltransferase involved in LPS biosynthesis